RRLSNALIPRSSLATAKRSPLSPSATSNRALATSIPTYRSSSTITAPHRAACPALQSGISFPYNRSGLSAVMARRPSLLDGVFAPRVHRPAAPRLSILLLHSPHTRLWENQ